MKHFQILTPNNLYMKELHRRYVKRTKFVRHKIFQDDQVIAGYRKKDNDIKETSMIEELRKRSFR